MRLISACSAKSLPYRVDIRNPSATAFEQLIDWDCLHAESTADGLAAIVPHSVSVQQVRSLSTTGEVQVSPAMAQDNDSVWILHPRPVQVGSLLIGSEEDDLSSGGLRLTLSSAFGSGHHPTTHLCLEALEVFLHDQQSPPTMLDIGTGSGILALAALHGGVQRATGLDVDPQAVVVARVNAELNGLEGRLQLLVGEPRQLTGRWPLITANLLTAPLIDMAADITRLLAPGGRLILSGIQQTLQSDVRRAYERMGVYILRAEERAGWMVLLGQASW